MTLSRLQPNLRLRDKQRSGIHTSLLRLGDLGVLTFESVGVIPSPASVGAEPHAVCYDVNIF